MIVECISAVVFLGAFWFFRKRKPSKGKDIELTKCVPSWSPINILWFDSLPPVPEIDNMSVVSDEHDDSVSDEGSWRVLADDHFTSRLREELDDFPSSTYANPDIVREELLDFPFPPSSGEQLDSEDGTEALARPISPPNGVLERGTTNSLMSVCSENFVK